MVTTIDLKQLMQLAEFINKFNLVKRQILKKDGDQETDGEHSFQLALCSWYLINKHNLNLEIQKVFKYALAHDLVETYAGDIDAYTQSSKVKEQKEHNEEKALKQIKSEFQNFSELVSIIEHYEAKKDKESKFVYALDKIIPVLNIELNNDDYYKRNKVVRDVYVKHKKDKVMADNLIQEYYKVLTNYLDEKGDFFYPGCSNRDFSNKYFDFSVFDKHMSDKD